MCGVLDVLPFAHVLPDDTLVMRTPAGDYSIEGQLTPAASAALKSTTGVRWLAPSEPARLLHGAEIRLASVRLDGAEAGPALRSTPAGIDVVMPVLPQSPASRSRFGAVLRATRGDLLVIGGVLQAGGLAGDLWRYDIAADHWRLVDTDGQITPGAVLAAAYDGDAERVFVLDEVGEGLLRKRASGRSTCEVEPRTCSGRGFGSGSSIGSRWGTPLSTGVAGSGSFGAGLAVCSSIGPNCRSSSCFLIAAPSPTTTSRSRSGARYRAASLRIRSGLTARTCRAYRACQSSGSPSSTSPPYSLAASAPVANLPGKPSRMRSCEILIAVGDNDSVRIRAISCSVALTAAAVLAGGTDAPATKWHPPRYR